MDRTGTVAVLGIGAGSMIEHRYHLSAILGRGAAADLWRAADLRLHRDVVIKLCQPGDTATRDLARANRLAAITHPALATIFDAGVDTASGCPRAYVVTELIDGQSLHDRLRYGSLAPRRIARIGSQVADALAQLHRRGVSHGSVSLANVVLRADGSVKLADLDTDPREADPVPADDVLALGHVLLAAFAGAPASGPARIASRWAWRRRPLATAPTGARPRDSEWTDLLSTMIAEDPSARPAAAEIAARLAGLRAAAAETRERDEPTDVNDDVAPLSVGHWRAPTARAGSSRSRVRPRGRHRRAAALQSAARDGDDAAA
ncbi:MAG TPA: protein kinase [Jatrophihabitantaceae bacterium]